VPWRGPSRIDVSRVAVERLRHFIEAHGESRFRFWGEGADSHTDGRTAFERAGFRSQTDEGWEYYVLPSAWMEIFSGMDRKQVNHVLLDKGFLVADGKGQATRTERLPGVGKSVRCYLVSPRLMEADDGT
jgi:putative DNA primase/helicase